RHAEFLGEFPSRRRFGSFVASVLAFRHGPGPCVTTRPERSAHVAEQHVGHVVDHAIQQYPRATPRRHGRAPLARVLAPTLVRTSPPCRLRDTAGTCSPHGTAPDSPLPLPHRERADP